MILSLLRSKLRKTPLKKIWAHYKYYRSNFYRFELSFHKGIRPLSNEIIQWADNCSINTTELEKQEDYFLSKDPLILEAYKLKASLMNDYKRKYQKSKLRVLILVTDQKKAPGVYSLFNNLIDAADFLGYSVLAHTWNDNTQDLLDSFKPNILLAIDKKYSHDKLDWYAIEQYRKKNILKIGLTASLEKEYNTPLSDRLNWAKIHKIDFYFVWDPQEYLEERKNSYQPFFDEGYKIYSYEYALNPMKYYPVPGFKRDLDFVFLGSGYKHKSKNMLYIKYYSDILSKNKGVLYGSYWNGIKYHGINRDRDRYIYSRGKVGLNLSIQKQLKWSSALNERTYMLAACGIPQLTDRPLLLKERFHDDEVFIADSPEEYQELFLHILNNPEEAKERAIKSLRRVFSEHTNFHRCESFFGELERDFIKN